MSSKSAYRTPVGAPTAGHLSLASRLSSSTRAEDHQISNSLSPNFQTLRIYERNSLRFDETLAKTFEPVAVGVAPVPSANSISSV